jgi:hypothetical protein
MGAFQRACTQQKMPVVLTLLKWLNSYQVCRAQLCYSHHFLESGADIRTVQEKLGHQDVKTTEIYTHVLNRGSKGVRSPFSDLQTIKEAAEKKEPKGVGGTLELFSCTTDPLISVHCENCSINRVSCAG